MDLVADNGAEGPDGEADVQADSDYGSYYPHHLEDNDGYLEPLEKRSASFFSSTPADLETEGTSPPLVEDQQVRLSALVSKFSSQTIKFLMLCTLNLSPVFTKCLHYTVFVLIN